MSTVESVATQCSIPGVAHAAQAERVGLRVMWIVFLLLTCIYPIYSTIGLIKKIQSKETRSTINIRSEPTLRFPAVTLCSQNPYKKSSIYSLPQLKALLDAYNQTSSPKQQPTQAQISQASPENGSPAPRVKRSDTPWNGRYWIDGFLKSPDHNGVWEASKSLIDPQIPFNKTGCSCNSRLALDILYKDPSVDSCGLKLECSNSGGDASPCVALSYQLVCVDPNAQLIPLCRAEAADNCTQPCPKLTAFPKTVFLLFNGACYYVRNCASTCSVNFLDAQKFCANAAADGRTVTLAHDFTHADMVAWILPVLNSHYLVNGVSSGDQISKCNSPRDNKVCCDGQSTERFAYFARQTEDDITKSLTASGACSTPWTAPKDSESPRAPGKDLCFEPEPTQAAIPTAKATTATTSTTTTSTTTTTTPRPTTTLKPLAPLKYNATQVASALALNEMASEPLAVQTTVTEAIPYVVGAINEKQRMTIGYQLADVIARCTFQDDLCNMARDFQVWNDVVLGNCFTFNGNNHTDPYYIAQAGERNGLRLLLKLTQDQYLPTIDTVGIYVFIHHHTDPIVGVQDGTSAVPGYVTSFDATYHVIQRLPPEDGGKPCGSVIPGKGYYYPLEYSQEGCLRSCYQDMVIQKCKCADPKYYYPKDSRLCDLVERKCVDEITISFSAMMDNKSLPCDCPWPCNDKSFPRTSTMSRLTPRHVCLGYDDSPECIYYSDRNLSIVQVYLRKMSYTMIEEVEKFSVSDLWTDFSNNINMWVNWTVISLFELAVIAILPCCRRAHLASIVLPG